MDRKGIERLRVYLGVAFTGPHALSEVTITSPSHLLTLKVFGEDIKKLGYEFEFKRQYWKVVGRTIDTAIIKRKL